MKEDYLYYLIITLIPIIFFSNLLSIDKVIENKGDLTQFSYPFFNYTTSSLNKGEINLWNPYNFLGEPLSANIQSQMFYPLNYIFFTLFPINFGITVSLIFHVILSGIFVFILCKDLKLNNNSSLFSSLMFMLNTYFVSKIVNHMILCTIAYLPIVFYFFKKSLEKSSIKYSFIAGFFLALSWLAGFAQISLYTALLLVLFFVFFAAKNGLNFGFLLKNIKFLIIPLLFSVFLAAIQLFPFLEFSPYSVRSNGVSYDFATVYSMSIHNFFTLFTPNFFGDGVDRFYWLKGSAFTETTVYFGIISLFLIVFASFFYRKEKNCQFFILLSIISIFLSFGSNNPFYRLIYMLPLFNSFRVPSKFLVLFMFASSILAGYGFQFLSGKLNKDTKKSIQFIIKKSIPFIIIIFVIGGINLMAVIYNFFQTLNINVNSSEGLVDSKITYAGKTFSAFEILKNTSLDLLFFVIFFALTVYLILKVINKKISPIYLLLLLFFNLFFYNFNFIRTWDIENIESPKELDYYKDNLGLFRYYDNSYQTNFNIIDEKYSIDGSNVMCLNYVADFFSTSRDYERFFNISTNLSDSLTYKKLDFMGVKYIFSQSKLDYDKFNLINETENYYIYYNDDPILRSFIYSNKDNSSKCNLLNDELNRVNNDSLEDYCLFNYSNITYYSSSRVIISVNSNISGYLVLTDTYYQGWQAYINGEKKPIEKIFSAFRAVKIDENTKEVIFSYEPISFKWGLFSSALSLILFFVILFN